MIVEEKLCFGRDDLSLAGVLSYPQTAEPSRVVLLCSPHPNFAGDMNNNIILALAKELATDSITLRFDYHGVGESDIQLPTGLSAYDYWDAVESNHDYTGAIDDVTAAAKKLRGIENQLPLLVIGYSFGAAMALQFGRNCKDVKKMIGLSPPWTRIDFSFLQGTACPTLLLTGKKDFLYCPDEVKRIRGTVSSKVSIEILEEDDHFFRGNEDKISRDIRNFIDVIGKF